MVKACKFKYRPRYFYSKGAFLVLLWTLLLGFVGISLGDIIARTLHVLSIKLTTWWLSLPLIAVTITALLSGLLADIKFGKYAVNKAGVVLVFIATVLNCSACILLDLLTTDFRYIFLLLAGLTATFGIVGEMLSFVSILQLGLDQMPDASTSSLTSFIVWYVFCIVCGAWVSQVTYHAGKYCLNDSFTLNFNLFWSISLVTCTGIILISDYLVSNKWLIKEPRSTRTFSTIFRVLKFAAKHKSPLNRSAFTYWEEDIPSRIDLGKSKYGGPFTTEQVENVKTILRLLLLSVSFWLVTSATFFKPPLMSAIPSQIVNSCIDPLLVDFIYCDIWIILLITVINELIIHPLTINQRPTILEKIGLAALISTISALVCLILEGVGAYTTEADSVLLKWIKVVLYSTMSGIAEQVLLTSVFEFIYAQSPYNIRGVFTGYTMLLVAISMLVGKGAAGGKFALYIVLAIKTLLCLAGFVLHCILAHWYKRRVRDDVYATHRVIEEVYDRYLSHSD